MREALAIIQSRADAATPGPWVNDGDVVQDLSQARQTGEHEWNRMGIIAEEHVRAEDADFIAHARTDVPNLVAAVEAVLALHEEDLYRGHLSNGCRTCGNGPNGEGYPCATVRAVEQALAGIKVAL